MGWNAAAAQALLARRGLLTAVLVGGFCFFDMVAPYGFCAQLAAAGHARLGWAIVLTGLAVNLGVARHLHRTPRPLIGPRLLWATVEAATITAALAVVAFPTPASGAVARGSVLMSELAFRRGALPAVGRSIAVASGTTLAAGWAASHTGAAGFLAAVWAYAPDSLAYTLGPMALGLALRAIHDHQVRSAYQSALLLGQAEVIAAELHIRSRLQIGAGGMVIDRLQGALWRLNGCNLDGRSLAHRLSRHKAAIAERVRASGAYLDDVLRHQAAAARSDDPVTSRHHFFRISPDEGQAVLTARQAAAVRTRLDGLDLRGEVEVGIRDREPQGTFVLVVGTHRVQVPAPRLLLALHIAPAGLVFAAAMQLTNAQSSYTWTPLWVVLPLAGTTIGLAWWVASVISWRGPAAARRLAWVSLVPLLFCLIEYWFARQLADSHRPFLPLATGLGGWGFAIGTFSPLIGLRRLLVHATTALALATAGMVVLWPRLHADGGQLSARTVLAEAVFGVMALVGTMIVAHSCADSETAVAQAVRQSIAEQAQRRAVEEEQQLLADTLADADHLLERAPDTDLARVAARELDEARTALDEINELVTTSRARW